MPEAGLITIVVALCWAPVAIIMDWLGFLKGLPPREAELAKASHGVGIIVCGWYALSFAGKLPVDYAFWVRVVYAALISLGVFWLCIGWSRALIYGDRRLQILAIIKIGVGVAIYFGFQVYQRQYFWVWLGEPVIHVVYLWCWATGVTKLVICSRSLPQDKGGPDDSFGTSDYDRNSGLRGRR